MMLEGLMRQTPKSKAGSPQRKRGSPRKNISIPELNQLESQIIMSKPNNTIQFIRDWANSKLTSFNVTNQKINVYSDDQQDIQPFIFKNMATKAVRRCAVWVNNSELSQISQTRTIIKLQETKSMILIKLRKMEILKTLNNEQLWNLVQQFQQVQFKSDECIIQRNDQVKTFYIVISGAVFRKGINKKSIQLGEGCEFGEDSILFRLPSPYEYISQGNIRAAKIQGRIISSYVRESNVQRYKIFYKAIRNIEYFKTLHEDEIDKVASIALNQDQIQTQILQQINLLEHPTSFFIILKGKFNQYARKITEQLRKQPDQQYKIGEAFGLQCLYGEQSDKVVISQDYGTVVQVKCNDIERVIGSLSKLSKRRKRRI